MLDSIEQLIEKSNAIVNDVVADVEKRLDDIKRIANNIPYYTFSRDQFEKYN